MFKRSLASCVAAAALASAVVVPANAEVHSGSVTVTVEDNVCKMSAFVDGKEVTDRLVELGAIDLRKANPDDIKDGLSQLAGTIENVKQRLKEAEESLQKETDEKKKEEIRKNIEGVKAGIGFLSMQYDMAQACISRRGGTVSFPKEMIAYLNKLDQSKNTPKTPIPGTNNGGTNNGGTNNGGTNNGGTNNGGTNNGGTNNTDGGKTDEGKPAPAKNPFVDEKGALNGAGIGLVVGGVLVGVLGLIAAALPAIAPLLPLQLRALLHI